MPCLRVDEGGRRQQRARCAQPVLFLKRNVCSAVGGYSQRQHSGDTVRRAYTREVSKAYVADTNWKHKIVSCSDRINKFAAALLPLGEHINKPAKQRCILWNAGVLCRCYDLAYDPKDRTQNNGRAEQRRTTTVSSTTEVLSNFSKLARYHRALL